MGPRLRELKISQLLSKILQIGCLQCFSQFDKVSHRPFMVGPCQHYYCTKCIDQVVFSRWEQSACPHCAKRVTKAGIRRDTYLEQVLDIQKQYSLTEGKSKISQLEQDIARKFLTTFEPFCRYCQEMFDIAQRRPVIVCKGQHIVCSQCLNGRFKDNGYCHVCSEPMLDKENLYHFKLFQLMVEFIKNTLFTRKLTFEVGERQFHLSVDNQVSIKDIFHCLQEHELISKELQINQCSFHQLVQLENQRPKEIAVKFSDILKDISKDGDITIVMQFAAGALKKGARVTMPSKIVKKLAIKINNFEPVQRFRYGQRDRFEDEQNCQMNVQQPLWKKGISKSHIKQNKNEDVEKPLYPDLHYEPNHAVYKPIKISQEAEKQIDNRSNNEVSASRLRMIKHSRLREQEKKEERNVISIMKSSKIPKRKQLEIGTEISEIYLQNYNTNVPQGNERDNIFANFVNNHIISDKDQSLICFKTEKVINKTFTEEEYIADAILEKEINAKAQKGDTLGQLLTILKKQIEDGDIRVLISPKSTQRSRTSLKIITSHFISDRIIIKQTFYEDENWYFEKIYQSQEQLKLFLDRQKRRASIKFGISEQSIVFHKLVKGPLVLYMSTNQGEEVARNIKRNLDRNLQIEPYFRQLELSPEDFDKAGLFSFPKNKKNVQFRGNWPYYQPINSIRYGIKVTGQFDQGQNTWLTMNNQSGEWAVGFHGVRNPNNNYKNYKNVIQSIIGSRSKSKIMIQSQQVSYQFEKCANKQDAMGVGILLTPSFEIALSQTESVQVGDKNYHLVFQCRLKPDQIKISARNNCKWIVNRSSAIRPYGIVIIQNDARLAYPTLQQQFGKPFLYQDYKRKIQLDLNK